MADDTTRAWTSTQANRRRTRSVYYECFLWLVGCAVFAFEPPGCHRSSIARDHREQPEDASPLFRRFVASYFL